MRKKLLITGMLVCFAAIAMAAFAGLAGKWKGSLKTPDGNEQEFHIVFNVDGAKLTGTAQAQGDPLAINDGKVTGDDFSFNVKDPDGNVIPVDGRYIAAGDSISLNFKENDIKFHLTFVREDK